MKDMFDYFTGEAIIMFSAFMFSGVMIGFAIWSLKAVFTSGWGYIVPFALFLAVAVITCGIALNLYIAIMMEKDKGELSL